MDEYKKLAGVIEDGVLLKRVVIALYKALLKIVTEPVDTPNHANRLAYAKDVISKDRAEALAPQYLKAVAVMSPFGADSFKLITDEQLQAAVDSAVDLWAVIGA